MQFEYSYQMKGNRSEVKTYWFPNHLVMSAHIPSCAALTWRPCLALPLYKAQAQLLKASPSLEFPWMGAWWGSRTVRTRTGF